MIKNIKVFFEQNKDVWVYLFLSSEDAVVKINLSPVFPPFDDILRFLESILNKNEVTIGIDQEGKIAELSALNFKRGQFHFVLINNTRGKKYILEGDYKIKDFVFEFISKLKKFSETNFDRQSWKKYKVEIADGRIKKIYDNVRTLK